MTVNSFPSCARTAAVVVAVLLGSARLAAGQAAIPGLRAPGSGTQSGQSLSLDLSGAMGRDVLRTANAADVSILNRNVTASSVSGSVSYGVSLPSFFARAHAASSGRRFSDSGAGGRDWSLISYGGGELGLSRQLSARTAFSSRASISYQPISATTLFPDLFRADGAPPLPTEFDLAIPLGTYLTSDVSVDLSRQLSRRSTLAMGYQQQYRSSIASGGPGQRSQSASVIFGRSLSRWLGMRLGYGYTTTNAFEVPAETPAGSPVSNHRVDVGVDANQGINLTRRTTLSFSTGTLTTSDGRRTRFDVTGSVDLTRRFARSASLGVGYTRDVDFVHTFAQPVIADSVAASFDATFGRALLTAGLGASRGQVGLTSGSDFLAMQSAVGTSFSLNRWLSLRADYAYYRYRFSTAAFLPIGIGARVRRHHFQVGTGLNLPLLGRSRRSNASR